MDRGTRNIFISHRHEDDHRLGQLKNLLRRSGLTVRDSSVYSGNGNRAKNEQYIQHLLRKRIRWAGTMIVLVSRLTRLSRWVNWEIERAQRTNTRIVGVWADGQDLCAVPAALKKYADAMVPWDGDTICDAVEDRVTGWHQPDGTLIDPFKLPNIKCG